MDTRFMFLIVIVLFYSCKEKTTSNTTFYKSSNSAFNYQGRTEIIKDSCKVLISSAASVEFFAKGNTINLLLQSGNNTHNYAVITLNGKYLNRYKISSDSITKIFLELPIDKTNKIGVFKATEAASGDLFFYGVEAEEINPIINDRKYFIEFIGDSVTCGAAADTSDVPCNAGEYLDQHNAYLAFGPRVARDLNLNFMLSSVSGIGIYRNWNDENIEEPIMPQVYENLYLNLDDSKKYDFSIKPDIVNICLGTNDLSYGDGVKPRLLFNREKFVENYISFVEIVYSYYPNTKIVLMNSPMIGGKTNLLLMDCLKEVQNFYAEKNKSIQLFELDSVYNNGCTTHPNINEHEAIAQKLAPFYENILNN
jgi:lysophospholipase L1-like esterase